MPDCHSDSCWLPHCWHTKNICFTADDLSDNRPIMQKESKLKDENISQPHSTRMVTLLVLLTYEVGLTLRYPV
jgi:hypothetical protein